MKFAFVKQDVYQDLYVAGPTAQPDEILFSSLSRVGPVGLFTLQQTDFLIVREEPTVECRAWERIIPNYRPEWFRQLRDRHFSETDFPEARIFEPGSPHRHSDFAVNVADVDWNAYDIVVGINFPIPRAIVERHRSVLWCYMVGEANMFMDHRYAGYDVALNQETRGVIANRPGIVDFPYSFVGPDCLERLMARALDRPSERRGIFLEINSIAERPATRIPPHLEPLLASGHPVRLHRQNIRDNLQQLYDAKYFVKSGGRFIRGNSVIEAISCGALVLMNPAELHHAQLLPASCWVHSLEEIVAKIAGLERDPVTYATMLAEQRARVQAFVVDAPLESLRNCLAAKRQAPPPPVRSALRRSLTRLRRRLRGDF